VSFLVHLGSRHGARLRALPRGFGVSPRFSVRNLNETRARASWRD
jgi:hypothetical protein